MNIYRKLKATLQLREAIRMAEQAHKTSGDRFYVMPNGIASGKLIIMDRYNFRKLKQKGYINRGTHISDLIRDAFYYTADKRGSGMESKHREERRHMYFLWIDHCITMNKRFKKHGNL